jgi:hypothetical protein
MGFDPKSTLVMKPHGSDAISLKGVLGEVAKVSVHEGKQFIFAPYIPFDRERASVPWSWGTEVEGTGGSGQRTGTKVVGASDRT